MSEQIDAKARWEERYAESERIWSGRPNARLVDVVSELTPGTALDLGCGEGGDSVWLAEHGWRVTAVDIADAALRRASELAAAAGADVVGRIDFQQHDLTRTFPAGTFDLVSAHFLHSPWDWDRDRLMRQAAAAVASAGTLLIVDHGAAPPWATHAHDVQFPSADEVVEGLRLDFAHWDRIRVEQSERDAVGPDGQQGALIDNVIVLRRR